MGKTSKTEGQSRRDFLKLAATAAPAAAASAVVADAAEASETPKGGLQDTAQTRAYYESARF